MPLKDFQNVKMSAKLSGGQNVLSVSAAKIFERTNALHSFLGLLGFLGPILCVN